MAASQYLSNRQAIAFFESSLSRLAPDTVLKYRRTISELSIFLSAHGLRIADIDAAMTADWTVALLRQGYATSTVARNLNILGSLIGSAAKKNMLPASTAPAEMARELRAMPAVPPLLEEKKFNLLIALLRRRQRAPQLFEDLLRVSLLRGAMPLEEVARLRKSELTSGESRFDPLTEDILRQHVAPLRSFIFPLDQSVRTPAQLRAAIAEGILPIARRLGIRTEAVPGGKKNSFDPDAFVRSLWASLALRAGATASEALACIDGDAPYTIPSFCIPDKEKRFPPVPQSITSEERQEWERSIRRLLGRDEPRWYAMKLRRGVTIEDLRKDISEKIRPLPEIFYPCETITRVVRNKKVVLDQPFIRSTVFFRTAPESVLPMFRLIGDRAWCYRVNNNPASPYAVIPTAEMRRFQAAVGSFTSDVEIHNLGELTPRPGEQVIIVKAGYAGREATVEEVATGSDGTAIIRVLLTTDQGFEWRLTLPARQVEIRQ